ncbi:MAG: hypothetical protein IIA51_02130 [Chloroflexi bacterium]|nr:hypothetical protein [Chloroflexota bacterium]MDK1045143.1 hypothetical protein [Anaerolineales bacterium]MCH8093614.1 hypothetical protein [Chloroflexota bacterium]MCH8340341.1 hypothetical protein [Chloroflexota bacterium]MCI0772768.1 hypothetical protein [Chloroflexota bacterium]
MSGSQSRGLFATAFLLLAIGWTGLYFLVATTLPTVGPRWLFFFLLIIAVTGTALPFVWLLHKRFGPAPSAVLLRQALWVALFASLGVWLQINRALTLSLALLLGIGFILVEWFLRLLERSVWRPNR